MNNVHTGVDSMFKFFVTPIRNWFRAEAERMKAVKAEIMRDEAEMQREALLRDLQQIMHRLQGSHQAAT
jgi:hypothetical protein